LNIIPTSEVTGLILAGGLGRRMSADGQGTNKALIQFNNRPMLSSVLDRLLPQVGDLIVNANAQSERIKALCPEHTLIVADEVGGFAGPLAGLHSAMQVCKTEWLLMVPCDSPLLPLNLAEILTNTVFESSCQVGVAKTFEQTHPVFMLASVKLLPSLSSFLAAGDRKIDLWYKSQSYVEVMFQDEAAFANINTLVELNQLQLSLQPKAP
jgi:molybdenum cofactor guanylyltransferase